MKTTSDTLLHHIEARLRSMSSDDALSKWGSAEALEYQAIQLLEMRNIIRRPCLSQTNRSEVRRAYRAFISKEFGGTATFLWAILARSGRTEALPSAIGAFVRHLDDTLLPESVFDTSRVGIEVQFPHGYDEPLLVAVCEYVIRFQKAIAALIRSHAAYRGYKLTFPMSNVVTLPANGVGPRVQLPLEAPLPLQRGLGEDFIPEDAFIEALTLALRTVSIVGRHAVPDAKYVFDELGFATKKDAGFAIQCAKELVPGGDVQFVTVGGKFVEQRTVVDARAARSFYWLLDRGKKTISFNKSGIVDMIDFRQGWFRLQAEDGRSYRCWTGINDAFMDDVKRAAPTGRLWVRGDARVNSLDEAKSHRRIVNVDVARLGALDPSDSGKRAYFRSSTPSVGAKLAQADALITAEEAEPPRWIAAAVGAVSMVTGAALLTSHAPAPQPLPKVKKRVKERTPATVEEEPPSEVIEVVKLSHREE